MTSSTNDVSTALNTPSRDHLGHIYMSYYAARIGRNQPSNVEQKTNVMLGAEHRSAFITRYQMH